MTEYAIERLLMERRVAKRLIQDALKAGYSLGVNDGEEDVIEKSQDPKAIFETMFSTDDDMITVNKAVLGKGWVPFGWVKMVYGNSGYDVISDYTTNLEDLIAPIYADLEPYDDYDKAKETIFKFENVQAV